jgi:hypothetical protein
VAQANGVEASEDLAALRGLAFQQFALAGDGQLASARLVMLVASTPFEDLGKRSRALLGMGDLRGNAAINVASRSSGLRISRSRRSHSWQIL